MSYSSSNDSSDSYHKHHMTSPCSSISSDEMTEEQYEQLYPTFDSQSEYLFVNKCLTLMHGQLPSYAYYQSNDEVVNFWNELDDDYYPVIYNYLIETEFIDGINTPDLDSDNFEHILYMKNAVIHFVFTYFENRFN